MFNHEPISSPAGTTRNSIFNKTISPPAGTTRNSIFNNDAPSSFSTGSCRYYCTVNCNPRLEGQLAQRKWTSPPGGNPLGFIKTLPDLIDHEPSSASKKCLFPWFAALADAWLIGSTSLSRKRTPLGSYSRTMSGLLLRS